MTSKVICYCYAVFLLFGCLFWGCKSLFLFSEERSCHPQGCSECFPVATHFAQSVFEKLACLFFSRKLVFFSLSLSLISGLFITLSRKTLACSPKRDWISLPLFAKGDSFLHAPVSGKKQTGCVIFVGDYAQSRFFHTVIILERLWKHKCFFFSSIVLWSCWTFFSFLFLSSFFFFNKAVSGWNFSYSCNYCSCWHVVTLSICLSLGDS